MPDIGISKEQQDSRHGRYVARIAGVEGEGEITFTGREPHLISADHTGAPETMRGTGAAAALVGYMIEDARNSGSGSSRSAHMSGRSIASIPNGRTS